MNDLDLVRRVLSGDEAAAVEWFDDHFERLYRFARARLDGDDEAAEEVVQIAMIKALRNLHAYRGEAALFTWLCTICRREIQAVRERASRHMQVQLVEDHPATRAALDALSAGEDPESVAGRRELSRLVQVALDHLPSRYARALEWRYIDGLTVTEIADRLGLGYKAAESTLSRAREAFREGFTALAGAWPPDAALWRRTGEES